MHTDKQKQNVNSCQNTTYPHLKLKTALNWLLPRRCLICNSTKLDTLNSVCRLCYENLPHRFNNCARCGMPYASSQNHCGKCIKQPPPYDVCFCAFEYKDSISHLIRACKYHDQPELALKLANLFVREAKDNALTMPDLFIPVPMHIKKLRQRGFNQSILLTQAISKKLEIPYSNKIVIKNKTTPAQANLPLKRRQKNLKDCFKYNKRTNAKHIVIIDDVITTGTTVTEMTKILKRNGVDYIQVWGIAQRI